MNTMQSSPRVGSNPFGPAPRATGYGTCEACGTTCIEVTLVDSRWVCSGGRCNPTQRSPRPGSNPTFSLHRIQHVTATVRTVSGSVYVVVARKGFVSMTLASVEGERYSWQPQAGESYTGAYVEHLNTRLTLVDSEGERVLTTSVIETLDLHEN